MDLSSAEVELWWLYARSNGFPFDRLEGAAVNAGAAAAQAMGSRVRARDLVPQFGDGRAEKRARLMAYLERHGTKADEQ
jgi:hypothetical protein